MCLRWAGVVTALEVEPGADSSESAVAVQDDGNMHGSEECVVRDAFIVNMATGEGLGVEAFQPVWSLEL